MRNIISIRILFLIIVFSIFAVSSYTDGNTYAQNARTFATGTVVDEQGQPIPGVNVLCQNSNYGTTTTIDGTFKIQTKGKNPILEFSFIGFQKQEITIKDPKKLIKVVMIEDGYMLDETVVIGYGTQTKRTITSAMTSIKSEELSGYVGSSIEQTISGLVPGVRIQTSDATPGGDINVEVRGIGTVTAGSEPLYIVDGIPMEGGLSAVNPDDVSNIQILKDAASTAVYGSRGANGVILITTKRGESAKPTITINAATTIAQIQHKFELMNTAQLLEYYKDKNLNERFRYTTNQNQDYFPFDENLNTDWQDAIFQNAIQQKYNLSIAGGSKNMRYRISGEYFDQEGIILTNRFRRYSLRTNVDHDISNAFQTGVSIALSKTINNRVPNDNVGNGIFTRSIEQRPFDVPFKEDGRYMIGGVDIPRHNGIQVLNEQKSKNEWYRVLANAYLTIKLLEGLEYKLSLSGDIRYSNDYLKLTKDHPYGSPKGEITDYRSMMQNYLIDNTLTYTKQIKDFNFTALGGYSMQEINTDASSIVGKDFPSSQFDYINAAGRINSASTTGGKNRLISTFFRLNMGYADRYLFTFSIRADGSSKFADGNQWGTFPSVSGAWRISNESFFPKDGIISDLKLRASWGMTGNQEGIGNYDSRSLANGGHNYNGQDGIAITTLANPDLKWEKSDQTNIGLDLSLFNDRVTVGMDYFIKNTKDLLYDRPLHTTTGFSSITQNIGSMRNTGFEFNVESHNIMNDRFSWDTQFNISTIKNKLTSLIDEKPIPVGNHVLQVGQPIGSFYMYKMDGIYQDNQEVPEKLYAKGVRAGDIKYADKDNDGDLTPADKEIVGKPLPDFFGGLTNRFRYGNFDLTIFNTFSVGNDVYATGMGGIDAVGHNNYGMRKDIAANRWTGPGTNNSIPRAMISTHNTQASTYLLHDGSYFKFKDVTLGYTLPSNLTQKLNISNMRVYLSAQNLWTISSYPGYDPEVSYSVNNSKTMGEDAMTVPQLRTFVCGFNLTF